MSDNTPVFDGEIWERIIPFQGRKARLVEVVSVAQNQITFRPGSTGPTETMSREMFIHSFNYIGDMRD